LTGPGRPPSNMQTLMTRAIVTTAIDTTAEVCVRLRVVVGVVRVPFTVPVVVRRQGISG